jgi:predicted ester cyclase
VNSNNFAQSKALIRDFYNELEKDCDGKGATRVFNKYCAENYLWRGMHPFYEQHGPLAVAEVFWIPLCSAFNSLQRRQDVFMAGRNDIDSGETEWVCSMGHMMGLFDEEWLGINPTRKLVFLPYVEFHRIEDGKIQETAAFCDIIRVMQQADMYPLPPQTGATTINPPPRTHDGLMFETVPPEDGQKTLSLINRMVHELQSDGLHSGRDVLLRTWHDRMTWFGPAGIGATYTLDRYEKQHQGPFSRGLADITPGSHLCRFAEGNYGGFFGWANLSMTPSGGFMGMPASDRRTEMRVVDIYRREDDKLAENWIFIDILHFLYLQGLDVLARTRELQA